MAADLIQKDLKHRDQLSEVYNLFWHQSFDQTNTSLKKKVFFFYFVFSLIFLLLSCPINKNLVFTTVK